MVNPVTTEDVKMAEHQLTGRAAKVDRAPLAKRRRQLLGAVGIVGGLALWQLAASSRVVDPAFASSPARVVGRTWELLESGALLSAMGSSIRLFAIGFGISLLLGLMGGIALGWYRGAHAVLDPWVSMLYAAPRIAFIPLVIVWFGIGFKTQVVIVVINAVFPILINTAAAVGAPSRDLLRVADSFGASTSQVLRTVVLPGAVPTLIAGIRTGMMIALLGTVVAEYFVGLTGIGGMIFNAGLTLDTDAAFVGAVVFAGFGLVLSAVLHQLQLRFERWR